MLDLRSQRRGGDVLFRIASQRRPGRSGLRSSKHRLAVPAAARHRRAGARMVVAAPQGGSNGPRLGARPTSAVRGRFGAAAMVTTAVAAADGPARRHRDPRDRRYPHPAATGGRRRRAGHRADTEGHHHRTAPPSPAAPRHTGEDLRSAIQPALVGRRALAPASMRTQPQSTPAEMDCPVYQRAARQAANHRAGQRVETMMIEPRTDTRNRCWVAGGGRTLRLPQIPA